MLALSLLLASLALPAGPQSAGGAAPAFPGAGIRSGGPRPGDLVPKPGGGVFVSDPHRNGRAPELHIEEVRVGRVVDVHGLDAGGAVDPAPVLRDFLVGETVQSDGVDYELFSSPTTQTWRLVVLRTPGAPEPAPGAGTFAALLRRAADAAPVLPVSAPDAPVVASVPRNGALLLRFDDLLADGASAALALAENVRVAVGAPPETPFTARVRFDEGHGGVAQGAFHSTRVLVDFTVSELEAADHPLPLPSNALGVPPGDGSAANVLVRLPTRTDPGAGQPTRLTNLAGNALSEAGNGPVDTASPTRDVLRAARGAGAVDANNGFLLDLEPPRIVGRYGVNVLASAPDPLGEPGYAFVLDYRVQPPCGNRPRVLDALELWSSGRFLEFVADGPPPSPTGLVSGARVRLAHRAPAAASDLLGIATLHSPQRGGPVTSTCWFGFGTDTIGTTGGFVARFSEPLLPGSADPFDWFRLVAGGAHTPADATNTVVARVLPYGTVSLTISQILPLAHVTGQATPYRLEVLGGAAGPTDLAGNALASDADALFHVDPLEPTRLSGGFVLRFAALDEAPGPGTDLRGALFRDLDEGTVRGRPPVHFGVPVDRTNPVPSIMIPFAPGISTPLNPLGAKLHQVWRYCDLGWSVYDETKYDVDVTGLSWAPVGGLVVADFFPQFEIRLAHSRRLPDEGIDANLLPRWPLSGLVGRNVPFTDNVLVDPLSPQTVVHPRDLGYTVRPADVFVSTTGTTLMPYPLNRGDGPPSTYTWRDTAVLAQGGPNGTGVPLDIEVGPPLFLETTRGALAPRDEVPSIGLPLLVEYRCYPTALGLGLNALDVSLALNSSAIPSFRSFSAGGVDVNGQVVVRDPDLEVTPSGGFNPNSSPPGRPTARADDNSFYIGQLDLVYRVSRAHSAWLDTGAGGTEYAAFLATLAPAPASDAAVEVAFRGATGFVATGGSESDATQLDAYGELLTGTASFLGDDATWRDTVDAIDGARFVQVRFTFVNDLARETSPVLDSFALAFQH